MSGPVWRVFEDEPISCDECLQEISRAMTEGTVQDGEFLPELSLCSACYEEHIHLLARRA